jgi:hypothetical protein
MRHATDDAATDITPATRADQMGSGRRSEGEQTEQVTTALSPS